MYRPFLTAASLLAVTQTLQAESLIPPVVVSAARTESSITTPASITIIDRAAIEASGAEELTDLLAGQGGIQIKDLYGDGSRATLGMRGLTGGNAAANSLILVDGRRLNNADLASPDISSIALKDIERIEIVEGSAGTLYGDQAVGGVIHIITRPSQRPFGRVEASYGSFDRTRLAAQLERSAGPLAFRLSAEGSHTGNYREQNARDYDNLAARADYQLGRGNLFAEIQHVNEELELPGALTREQAQADPQQVDPIYAGDHERLRTDLARLGLRQGLGQSWQLEAELAHRESDGSGRLFGGDFTQARRHTALTPRLVGSLPLPGGEGLLTLGLDLDKIDYRFDSAYVANDSTQESRALYAQAVVPLGERLSLTGGARSARVEYDLTDQGAFPAGHSQDDEVTVWELGASFRLTPEWRLFARRDGNLRFAKVDELTFTSPGATLETQTGVSYEAGAEWSRGPHRAKALIYRLDLDNEIDYDTTAPGPWGLGANVNLEETRRSGLILEGRWGASERLALEASYSYTDPEMAGGPFSGNTIPFVASHSARLAADYRLTEAWDLHAELVHTGERYQDADYTNTLPQLDPVSVVNVAAHWRTGPWRLTGRVENLTDEEYPVYAAYAGYSTVERYYPAPGVNGSLTVSYSF